MKTMFWAAYSSLVHSNEQAGLASTQRVLRRLGIEALAEHADWLLMHRERPLELPKMEL
jgi:hypothetical protein